MVLWKEDLWNVHHLADLGEEGCFGEEGTKEELGQECGDFRQGASLHSISRA